MKKILSYILLVLVIFIAPLFVFAEEDTNNKVKVYFFHGDGCPHCEEAQNWFDSIQEEYGNYFEIVAYETWDDEDNAELMQQVAAARGEEAEGVPYIIIGDKSWNGFDEAEYAEDMKEEIKNEFNKTVEERYDIMKLLPEINTANKSNKVLPLILILIVISACGFGIYKARSTTN